MDKIRIGKMLLEHEGYRQFVYRDTVGKLTVGIGRNLEDKGITEDEAQYLLDGDISFFNDVLMSKLPYYQNLDEVRKAVLLDMVFNMGTNGLFKFKNTLSLIENGDYESASIEMLNSQWATQVGRRANELSEMMATGSWGRYA